MPMSEGYVYSGLHAFIFVDGPTAADVAELVEKLQGREARDERLRFATETVGGVHKGIVHIAVADENDLAGLQDLLAGDVSELGVGSEVAILGPPYVDEAGTVWPAKPRRCEVLAFTRIWVERGQAGKVLNALQGAVRDVFHGASIVYGTFDILLVLDGSDYVGVASAALEAVPMVEGIVRTETSFADVRRYGPYAEED